MSNYKRNEENKNSNNSGIYAIVNLVNGKRYVGQTYDLHHRWIRHKSYLKNNTNHNRHLQAAWNKYGEENFKYEVLEKCDFDLLDEREIYWINYYDCLNNGYNFSEGGIGCKGYKHTEEEILKMRMIQNPEPVVQLDLEGNYLNTFISCGEAGAHIGKKSVAGIKLCCEKKKYRKAYGYIWVYEKDYKNGTVDWDYYFQKPKNQKKPVLQYDMNNFSDISQNNDKQTSTEEYRYGNKRHKNQKNNERRTSARRCINYNRQRYCDTRHKTHSRR